MRINYHLNSGRQKVLALSLLFIVFILALALRLIYINHFAQPPESDALGYHKFALNYLSGHGHAIDPGQATSYRPPLYPLFLASIYKITNPDYRNALYAQAILNAALIFAIFFICYRISANRWVGLMAAICFAMHTSFEIVSRLYRENLIILLTVLFIWTFYEAYRKPQLYKFILAGLLVGLLGLATPVFMPFGVILFLFIGILLKEKRLRKKLFVLALISILVLVPWMIRNQIKGDGRQATHMNSTLLFGYYPAFSGKWWWPVSDMEELEKERTKAREYFQKRNESNVLKSQLPSHLMQNPVGAFKLFLSRVLLHWVSPPVGTSLLKTYHPFFASLGLVMQYLFVTFGLITLIKKSRSHKEITGFLILALYATCIFALTHSIRRYGYPMVPILCIFFSWGIIDFFNKRKMVKD
jgi:4-amino-4-deoxy-L-arabinose transferase-like glycosyltransferase